MFLLAASTTAERSPYISRERPHIGAGCVSVPDEPLVLCISLLTLSAENKVLLQERKKFSTEKCSLSAVHATATSLTFGCIDQLPLLLVKLLHQSDEADRASTRPKRLPLFPSPWRWQAKESRVLLRVLTDTHTYPT